MRITISSSLRKDLNDIYHRAVETNSSRFFCTNMCLYAEALFGSPSLTESIEKVMQPLLEEATQYINTLNQQATAELKEIYLEIGSILKANAIKTESLELSRQDSINLIFLKTSRPEIGMEEYRLNQTYQTLHEITKKLPILIPNLQMSLDSQYIKYEDLSETFYLSTPLYSLYASEKSRITSIRNMKIYYQWSDVEQYRRFISKPEFENNIDSMIHEEILVGFVKVMENDPPIDEADWGDGEVTYFSPKTDRQSLILFHNWLLTESQQSTNSNSEVEAVAGAFTAYLDGSLTYLDQPINLAVRPAEILRLFIGKPSQRITSDEIIESTFPVEQQRNTKRYRNLSQSIVVINNYLRNEFEIERGIKNAGEKVYIFEP